MTTPQAAAADKQPIIQIYEFAQRAAEQEKVGASLNRIAKLNALIADCQNKIKVLEAVRYVPLRLYEY